MGQKPGQRGPVLDGGNAVRCEPECVPGSQVCTPVRAKTAGARTQCWCGFAGNSPPEAAKSATKGIQNLDTLAARV
ncbi:MAG: hypothetical protein HRU78_09595 [Gammaproteobacteria bacterium]|nr:MAG: hypothetical protein HRU78_09595 [Gammaproteobacteria bacterium]